MIKWKQALKIINELHNRLGTGHWPQRPQSETKVQTPYQACLKVVPPSSKSLKKSNFKKHVRKIKTHRGLKVFQHSFEAGMEIFQITKTFPKEETYSLTDQIRRYSRSVSGNLAEAFRKRRYPKSFIAKLSDSEGEAAETQVWPGYAPSCKYIDQETHIKLIEKYGYIISMIVIMSSKPENWRW